jgi:hypothetical protein
MGQAISSSMPLAVAIALSPIPIIAVLLMLTSRQARVNGAAFVAGWLAGLGVTGAIILALARTAGAGKPSGPAVWMGSIEATLGIVLLLAAAWQFRRRPRRGNEPPLPKWMATIDRTSPPAAGGLAVVLSGANPKNLVLAAGGAAVIARTGIPEGQQAIAYGVFALVATFGAGIPVLMYFAMGERSARVLAVVKGWMIQHSAVIVSVLCLVIAAKLIGDAVSALAS